MRTTDIQIAETQLTDTPRNESTRAIQGSAVVKLLVDEAHAKSERTRTARAIPLPVPIPIPLLVGSRFFIWKQDPTVLELGRRLVYIPGLVLDGPHDSRITTNLPGVTPVARSTNGDFIFNVADSPEADCAHTFAVVRQTLTMYERLRGGTKIDWVWNTGTNTDVLTVFPRAGVTQNAFYSRTQKALKFFFFTPTGSSVPVFTCRSLDVVSHETGHAILDGLKPGWLTSSATPQTGALHESFGDLTALFLALSQLDQVEAAIAITKGNLHEKNFLRALAEQFGSALGLPDGLRNADNDLKLSQVSNEVHALSQVFTGGIYDVVADIYAFERSQQSATKDPAQVLLEVGQRVARLLLKGIDAAPPSNATFTHVVNGMLNASFAQGDPPIYRSFIRNRFTLREVVVSPTPLTGMPPGAFSADDGSFVDGTEGEELQEFDISHPSLTAAQDRSECCGTMQHPEYNQTDEATHAQLKALRKTGAVIPAEDVLAGFAG